MIKRPNGLQGRLPLRRSMIVPGRVDFSIFDTVNPSAMLIVSAKSRSARGASPRVVAKLGALYNIDFRA